MRALPALLCALWACAGGGGSGAGGGSGTGGGAAGDCTPVKTPRNLVQNAGFECGTGGPDAWAARDGTLAWSSDAHSGAKAALLTVPSAGQGTLLYRPDVAAALGTQTYCATVFVKGTAPDVKLILRKVFSGSVEDRTFSAPVTQAYARVPPNLVLDVPGSAAQKLLLLVQTITAKAGDTLLVDDLDVCVSTSGDCKEAR